VGRGATAIGLSLRFLPLSDSEPGGSSCLIGGEKGLASQRIPSVGLFPLFELRSRGSSARLRLERGHDPLGY
jgi:hypothetical protein